VIDTPEAMAKAAIDEAHRPLPADDDEALATIKHTVPICADESCHTFEDLEHLAQDADWVDLDAPLLLARDRQPGLRFDGSMIYPASVSLWG